MQNVFSIILTALVRSFRAPGGVGSSVSVSLRNNSVWKTEKADKNLIMQVAVNNFQEVNRRPRRAACSFGWTYLYDC